MVVYCIITLFNSPSYSYTTSDMAVAMATYKDSFELPLLKQKHSQVHSGHPPRVSPLTTDCDKVCINAEGPQYIL